jgi:hypothetical protein
MPVPTNYTDILAQLADTLKPGGTIEKSYIDEANQEAKNLGAQLNAASVAKGLGNATSGTPVTTARFLAKRKGEIRSGLLQQFLGTLQFLANMNFQGQQAKANRATETAIRQGPSLTERGLNAFGEPFMSLAPQVGFSTEEFPSLAAAGGMNNLAAKAPSLFGGGTTGTPSSFTPDYSLLPNKTATLSNGGKVEYW